MRKALIVGIDHYSSISHLHGCVNDAYSTKAVLERHADGTINFDVKLLTGTGPSNTVSRTQLKDAVKDLFAGDAETALFYFAGHGFVEVTGGYLITSECNSGDDGLSLNDVLVLANGSASLSEILCVRHTMTTRSMYAEQDEVEECRHCREIGGAAQDSPRIS